MKKIWISAVMIMIAVSVYGQQDPYYTNWMFNRLAYNPAYAGTRKGVEFTGLQHIQWTGYQGDQAPNTQSFTVSAPLKKHGIGLNFFHDRAGYEKTVNATVAYNYKINIGNGVLAIGAQAGMIQKSLDGTKLRPEITNDAHIPVTAVTATRPDFGLGMYYSNEQFYHFYAGISSLHLSQEDFEYESLTGSVVRYLGRRHYYAVTGVELPLSASLKLRPNLLFKNDGTTSQLDVNLDLVYNDAIRGGLSYRSKDAVCALIGFYPSKTLHLGYSYDFTLSNLNRYSKGSHEIFITYLLPGKQQNTVKTRRPVGSPRFLE